MSKPMSEQMQKLADRYEKATGKKFDVKTNAQKIRGMSDEKLAVFLSKDLKQPCDYCQLAVFEGACTETLCEDAMMKWLQMPAEEDDEDDHES